MRNGLIALCGLAVIVAAWTILRDSGPGASRGPAAGAGIRTSRADLDAAIVLDRKRVAADPGDGEAAVRLADLLMRGARVGADASLAIEAERVPRSTLQHAPSDYMARRMLGVVYLSQHRFTEALEEAGAMRRATRLGTVDPRIRCHASAIASALSTSSAGDGLRSPESSGIVTAGSWLRIQLKHYTGADMIRRAFAFIVAVLVIAAPVAAQICGAACSGQIGHANHSGPAAQDHSAHHSAHLAQQGPVGAERAVMRSLPRTCGELQAVVGGSRDTASSVAGPAVKSALWMPAVAQSAASFDADARRAPPRPIRSISLLRV